MNLYAYSQATEKEREFHAFVQHISELILIIVKVLGIGKANILKKIINETVVYCESLKIQHKNTNCLKTRCSTKTFIGPN